MLIQFFEHLLKFDNTKLDIVEVVEIVWWGGGLYFDVEKTCIVLLSVHVMSLQSTCRWLNAEKRSIYFLTITHLEVFSFQLLDLSIILYVYELLSFLLVKLKTKKRCMSHKNTKGFQTGMLFSQLRALI